MSVPKSVARHAKTLASDGVVVLDGYLDEAACDSVRRRIESTFEEGIPEAAPDEDYGDLVSRGEPVVNRRSGKWDDGMLDVFNMASEISELASFKQDDDIAQIVERATEEPYSPDNVNVYINRSVTNTRDFHADTYTGKFKSFLYLTDVPDESYGPFSYVRGSHEKSALIRRGSKLVNRVRGSPETDAVVYDESDRVVCTASKGTLIIADQSGYHRGIPQDEGRERMLATTSYTPK
jgi:hypothetical protein